MRSDHRTRMILAHRNGEDGFQARCTCGWLSPFQGLESSVEILIEAHADLSAAATARPGKKS